MATGLVWWHTAAILAPGELRQGNCEFKASVGKFVGVLSRKEKGKEEKREKEDKIAGKTSG